MWSILSDILFVLNESAGYLLFGFLLAGFLHVALGRMEWLVGLIAKKSSKAVAIAALIGMPLPLCSCSVLPAALTLRRKGASKGATVSFLISVPETDIVSIILTYGLLGPVMAVFRPLAAVATAIITGLLTNIVDRSAQDGFSDEGISSNHVEASGSCGCGDGKDISEEGQPKRGKIAEALHYGFVEFFGNIIGMILVGIVLGGLITALLPDMGLERFTGGSLTTMLVMLVVGIPMYVCATASTPIAVGLIVAGLSPGAALVFLLAGPATNIGSLVILRKELGKAVVIVYICSIAVVSVLMGLALDASFNAASLQLPEVAPLVQEGSAGPLKIVGSTILLVLAYLSARRAHILESWVERVREWTGLPLTVNTLKCGVVAVVVLGWLASGLFVVGPGERGMVTRFGGITGRNLEPGLHYHWPVPLGSGDIASIQKVRGIELGFRSQMEVDPSVEDQLTADVFRAESWMLTGNEDIIDIRWVVQYRVKDADNGNGVEQYLYGVDDPHGLLRCMADAAIRSVVAERDIDTLLTIDRDAVEKEIKTKHLQPWLDRCGTGIEIVQVNLVDVHSPQEVHWAFRDVASATEDKVKSVNLAHEYAERVVLGAKGQADSTKLEAEGEASRLVQYAHGLGKAFGDRVAAYRKSPAITRLRLHLEAIDDCLPGMNKYVVLSEAIGESIDLWLVNEEAPASLPAYPTMEMRKARP